MYGRSCECLGGKWDFNVRTDANLFTLCNCILKMEYLPAYVCLPIFHGYTGPTLKVRCYRIILECFHSKTFVVTGFKSGRRLKYSTNNERVCLVRRVMRCAWSIRAAGSLQTTNIYQKARRSIYNSPRLFTDIRAQRLLMYLLGLKRHLSDRLISLLFLM